MKIYEVLFCRSEITLGDNIWEYTRSLGLYSTKDLANKAADIEKSRIKAETKFKLKENTKEKGLHIVDVAINEVEVIDN